MGGITFHIPALGWDRGERCSDLQFSRKTLEMAAFHPKSAREMEGQWVGSRGELQMGGLDGRGGAGRNLGPNLLLSDGQNTNSLKNDLSLSPSLSLTCFFLLLLLFSPARDFS